MQAAGRSQLYWPGIDGLRALAVAAVLLFHLDRRLLPGGYVGVDVFFVISGFLITGKLTEARGLAGIVDFYQHRIARILPLLALTVVATLAAAAFVYDSHDLAWLGLDSTAAILSVLNVRLAAGSGYFHASPDAQPLLHCWSLAVEEQFYLVLPPLLALSARLTRRPERVLGVAALLSLAACVWLTATHPTLAYYALPTRAWELLAGAILRLVVDRRATLTRHADAIGIAGLASLAASTLIFSEASPFPGALALLPVLGSACVIASVLQPSAIRNLLATPRLVAAGRRSYALYLWHWPVFSLVDYQFFQQPDALRVPLKLALTVLLTWASHRWVEVPARRALRRAQPRAAYAVAGVLSLAIAGAGYWTRHTSYLDASPASIGSGGRSVAGGTGPSIVLIGDSLATMYGRELAAIARRRGYRLHLLATPGRAQLPGQPATLWPQALSFVAREKPDVVVLAGFWSARLRRNPRSLPEAVAALSPISRVLLLAQPPRLPDAASRAGVRAGASPPFAEPVHAQVQRLATLLSLRGQTSGRVTLLDVAPALTRPDGSLRAIGEDGRMSWSDPIHLADGGTARIGPLLDRAILNSLESPRVRRSPAK